LTRKLKGLNGKGLGWPHRLIFPNHVDGVCGYRLQPGANLCTGRSEALSLVCRDEPWVKAQHIALFEIVSNPRRRWFVNKVLGGEQFAVHLGLHLNGVAAIHKDGALLQSKNGQPPRTGKSGEPFQALGIGCHIFTLKFVLTWNDEAREL
jgi:hypothetical protein